MENFLNEVDLFSSLTPEHRGEISKMMKRSVFLKGESIFHEGDEASSLYVVYRGAVKVFKLSDDGREHILHLLRPPDIIAEVTLFEMMQYPASCYALEDSVLLSLSKKSFLEVLCSSPAMMLSIMSAQAQKLREFAFKIELLSSCDVRKKVCRYLKHNMKIKNGEYRVKREGTMADIAGYIGTSRESVSRVISALVQSGAVEKGKGEYLIVQPDLLG
jgi:CRP-like cAMP-binding protein